MFPDLSIPRIGGLLSDVLAFGWDGQVGQVSDVTTLLDPAYRRLTVGGLGGRTGCSEYQT